MKNYLATILTAAVLLGAESSFGQVVFSQPVSVGNSNNAFPIMYTAEGFGTSKQVQDIAGRNAIPSARRAEGMTCYVATNQTVYRLVNGISDSNWIPDLSFGSGLAFTPTTRTLNVTPTGAAVFVGPNGNDNNNGSSNSPLATLNAAVTKSSGVGTVIVLNGDYTNGLKLDGSLATNITISGQGSPRVFFGQPVSSWSLYTGTVYQATVTTNSFAIATLRIGVDFNHDSFIHEFGTPEAAIYYTNRLSLQGDRDYRLENFRLRYIPVGDIAWASSHSGSSATFSYTRDTGLRAGDTIFITNAVPSAYNGAWPVTAESNIGGNNTSVTFTLGGDPGTDPSNRGTSFYLNSHIENCPNGTWTITNTTLYVKFSDGAAPGGRTVYLPSTDTNTYFVGNCKNYSKIYVQNISEYFGYEGVDLTGVGYFEAHGCTFYGNGDEGIFSGDMSQGPVLLQGLNVAANDNDGMGYYGVLYTTNSPKVSTESECWVHDNADEGTSAHYGALITSVNGLYEYNQSGGITPYAGSLVDLYNVVSRFNDVGWSLGGVPTSAPNQSTWTNRQTKVSAISCSVYGNRLGASAESFSWGQAVDATRCYFDNTTVNIALYPGLTPIPQQVTLRDCTFGPTLGTFTAPASAGFLQPTIYASVSAYGITLLTNSLTSWPVYPPWYGASFIGMSNDVCYLLKGSLSALTWVSTNVVPGAGGGGGGQVGATTNETWANILQFGGAAGATNDVAFSNALYSLVDGVNTNSANSADLFCPPGVYNFNSLPIDRGGGAGNFTMFAIPHKTPAISYAGSHSYLRIHGNAKPMYYSGTGPTGPNANEGTVFMIWTTNQGYFLESTSVTNQLNGNGTSVQFENITFRVQTNSALIILGLKQFASYGIDHCNFDHPWAPDHTFNIPVAGTGPFEAPQYNLDIGHCYDVLCEGFDRGPWFGEHNSVNELSIVACAQGLMLGKADLPNLFGRVLIQNCPTNITVLESSFNKFQQLVIEKNAITNSPGNWMSNWWDLVTYSAANLTIDNSFVQNDQNLSDHTFRYISTDPGIKIVDLKDPLGTISYATTTTLYLRAPHHYFYHNGTFGYSAMASRGDPTAPAALQNGDGVDGGLFYGYDGTGYTLGVAWGGIVDGTPSAGSMPSDFAVYTGTGGVLTQQLVVVTNGNVGIHFPHPSHSLVVSNNIAACGFMAPTNGLFEQFKPVFYTAYSPVSSDCVLYVGGTNVYITLGDAATNGGKYFDIYSVTNNGSVIITNYNGSQTINSVLSWIVGATNWMRVRSDGAVWH